MDTQLLNCLKSCHSQLFICNSFSKDEFDLKTSFGEHNRRYNLVEGELALVAMMVEVKAITSDEHSSVQLPFNSEDWNYLVKDFSASCSWGVVLDGLEDTSTSRDQEGWNGGNAHSIWSSRVVPENSYDTKCVLPPTYIEDENSACGYIVSVMQVPICFSRAVVCGKYTTNFKFVINSHTSDVYHASGSSLKIVKHHSESFGLIRPVVVSDVRHQLSDANIVLSASISANYPSISMLVVDVEHLPWRLSNDGNLTETVDSREVCQMKVQCLEHGPATLLHKEDFTLLYVLQCEAKQVRSPLSAILPVNVKISARFPWTPVPLSFSLLLHLPFTIPVSTPLSMSLSWDKEKSAPLETLPPTVTTAFHVFPTTLTVTNQSNIMRDLTLQAPRNHPPPPLPATQKAAAITSNVGLEGADRDREKMMPSGVWSDFLRLQDEESRVICLEKNKHVGWVPPLTSHTLSLTWVSFSPGIQPMDSLLFYDRTEKSHFRATAACDVLVRRDAQSSVGNASPG